MTRGKPDCVCGHPWAVHQHAHQHGNYCGPCPCPAYRRPRWWRKPQPPAPGTTTPPRGSAAAAPEPQPQPPQVPGHDHGPPRLDLRWYDHTGRTEAWTRVYTRHCWETRDATGQLASASCPDITLLHQFETQFQDQP